MAKVRINQVTREINDSLFGMLDRAKGLPGFLKRVTYRQYQQAQLDRWETEGASEGTKWPALNARYAEWKTRRYGGGVKMRYFRGLGYSLPIAVYQGKFPGNGRKMMIATGTLIGAVIGPVRGARISGLGTEAKTNHRSLATMKGLEVSWDVPYASDANEKRNFETLSDKTTGKMIASIFSFLMEAGE